MRRITKNRNVHLVCNAHLDPVWQWQLTEGLGETLATFRTATDLCEEYDNFIFNHNEALLYQWILVHEPELFARIQRLVKLKKWGIIGGWYLQPDCNMPSGESFVRQILVGRNFFAKHFGIKPKTSVNFDPFGHSRGLVQIMAKSGYDSYLFGRPHQEFLTLPADEFIWTGDDNCKILAVRFSGWYNSELGKARQKIEKWLQDNPDKSFKLILWGVGNHGGGPSRKDIEDIDDLAAQTQAYRIKHSTLDKFFEQLRPVKNTLPSFGKSLNPWAPGCYTSQIRIKQKHRQLENEFYQAEKMASFVYAAGLDEYPKAQLDEILESLLLSEFHDILPGSSIQTVEEDCLNLLGHGLEIASRVKMKAFVKLCSGQPRARQGEIPVMVFHSHAFAIEQDIECEMQLPTAKGQDDFTEINVYDAQGKKLPSQVEKEEGHLPLEWRKKVVFRANVKPFEVNRFSCHLDKVTKKMEPEKSIERGDNIRLKNDRLEVIVNTKTGLLDSYKVDSQDYVASSAFMPIVIKDTPDSWGMNDISYRDQVGSFKLMSPAQDRRFSGSQLAKTTNPVRIIEDGAVRTVVEANFIFRNSFINQKYIIPKHHTEISLIVRVFWNEKDHLLKLAVPLARRFISKSAYIGQGPYCREELNTNGDEAVSQKWCAVVSEKRKIALTCINDCIYGSDYSAEGLRLTLLRSPAYTSCSRIKRFKNRFIPRIDQGERVYHFWFNAGDLKQRLSTIEGEALARNEKPFTMAFSSSGKGKKVKPLVRLGDKSVTVTVVKQAEDNGDLIIRLFEPTGRKRTTWLSFPVLNKKCKLTINPFEIKTLRLNLKTKTLTENNLLEKPGPRN